MPQTPEQIAADAAVAQAAANARDAQDAALADAAMSGGTIDWGATEGDGGQADPASVTTPATPPASQSPRRAATRFGGDETGELLTDDFGLDGDMAATFTKALQSAFNVDDEGNLLADPASSPDPAQTPPVAPVADGEDGAGVGGDVDAASAGVGNAAPGAPAPVVPTADPAPTEDFSLDQYATDYFGRKLTREESASLFGAINNLQNATPEQRQIIERVLANQPVDPSTFISHPQTAPQPVGQQPTNLPIPGLPPRPSDDDYEAQQYYDRFVAPLAAAQAQQIAQLQANIDATTQAQMAQDQAARSAVIDSAASGWRNDYALLSDGEFDALTARVIQTGTFPALVQSHRGDLTAATRAAYEQVFWSDPSLRQRAMANAASGRDPLTALPDAASQQAQEQAQLEAGRRQLAASVAGGGGHAPNRVPEPPKTKQERLAAMTAEIAAATQ